MSGNIYIGVGGWTFEPWRGTFYPDELTQKRELEYMSRQLTSIEINGTYYSTFKRDSWEKWGAETPKGFKFSVKASRFSTNRKVLSDDASKQSMEKFFGQGMAALGDKLGPINWQFMGTKKFDPADFGAFLKMLPKEVEKVPLRHAIEVRHASFCCPEFYDMAAKSKVAICYAKDEDFPEIEQPTADFTYARLMSTSETLKDGIGPKELKHWTAKTKEWARRGDVFAYFISGAKVKNPAAAQALIKAVK
ncbi:MAG TPA: DUF72 domain-containing protein [Caulobacteraceae bacterium]|jgi:uncharacterized protein YecE (DUF72 family)|nr:DUF72 domain-containing protein [Caulobacteraceae bacterium]